MSKSQRAMENRKNLRNIVVKSSGVPTTPAVKGQVQVKVKEVEIKCLTK